MLDMAGMSLTSAVRRAALVQPRGLAIRDGTQPLTWPAVAERVARLAAGLRAMGVRKGDPLAVLALNSARHFELLFAAWWAGAVLVPLNTRLAAGELAWILRHAQAGRCVTDDAMSAVAAAAVAQARVDGHAVALARLDDATWTALLAHPPMPDASPDFESLAGIFYTGGTTGLPKGVRLSHRNMAFAAGGMLRDLALAPRSVYLHAAPMFHLADFGIGLATTLAAAGHAFMDRFTPEAFYGHLRDHAVTHVQLVPTMLAAVLDAPCRDDALLARLERIAYGAAPISQALLRRLLQACPQARITQFYGMTECCGATVMLPPERHVLEGPMAGKLEAAGQVVPGFELRIADDGDAALPAGAVGEIQMRGPALTDGYWQDPDQSAAAFTADGWLKSGDAGRLDGDGFLYVVDRLKDMIITGGENVYGSEVENALASHPAVRACAVVGLPDPTWGERVHAVVVLDAEAGATAQDLDAHCRARIAGYKVPRGYAFVDALPLSGVGKVQKQVLRARYRDQGSDAR